MSNEATEWQYAAAIDQAVDEAEKRGLSDRDFDDFVNQRADELVGELPEFETNAKKYSDGYYYYKDRMCPCGTPIEECADAYEHATQGF